MTLSSSRQSFEDCYELMDNALAANMGVRIGFETQGEAKHFRGRINQARTLDRMFNTERYELTDPRCQKSEYDVLKTRLKHSEGMYWIYIEKWQKPKIIEEITEEPKPIREIITHRRF